MSEITAEELIEKLKLAGQQMTAEDVRKQKISFIKGTLSSKIEVTDEQIEAELDRFAGTSLQT